MIGKWPLQWKVLATIGTAIVGIDGINKRILRCSDLSPSA